MNTPTTREQPRTSPAAGTIVRHNDTELVTAITAAGLGPARAAEMRPVGDTPVMFVELEPSARHKARVLALWLLHLDAIDMVAGKSDAADPVLRLILRGRSPAGRMVVVAAPYSEHTETRQADLIRAHIEHQQPDRLVAALAALEDTTEEGPR